MKHFREVSSLAEHLGEILQDPNKSLALHALSMNAIDCICSLLLQHPELGILKRTRGIIFDR